MAMEPDEKARRKRLSEASRRAHPVIGVRIREQRRARYADGGRDRQRAYYDKMRLERFFKWRARLWSSRWKVQVTEAQLINLWVSQDGRCALSGRPLGPDAHLDHIQPVSSGGGHTIDNLRWLDPTVNVALGALSDAEFLSLCFDIIATSGSTS